MTDFDDGFFREVIDQDVAVLKALASVDRGLFDTDESRDEDLQALYDN